LRRQQITLRGGGACARSSAPWRRNPRFLAVVDRKGHVAMSSSSVVKSEPTAWTGWIAFAALMMLMIGIFNAISGLTAVVENELFLTGPEGALIVDMSTWGWVHLLLGAAVAAVGAFLLRGASFARYAAIALVMLNMVSQMLVLPAYPVWAVTVIVIDLVVLWALVVHGHESVQALR
jgi:hypothetical protein